MHEANNPFKVQERLMDFNITEYKMFIDTPSELALHLTLKKLSTC